MPLFRLPSVHGCWIRGRGGEGGRCVPDVGLGRFSSRARLERIGLGLQPLDRRQILRLGIGNPPERDVHQRPQARGRPYHAPEDTVFGREAAVSVAPGALARGGRARRPRGQVQGG